MKIFFSYLLAIASWYDTSYMFLSCNEFSNIYIERGVKYSYRNCLLLGMGERERERNIVTETAYSLAAMDKDVFYELR